MHNTNISDRLRSFLFESIDSVELIEVLLFLQSDPLRAATPIEISSNFRSNPKSVLHRLENLVQIGLAEQVDAKSKSYKYHPKNQVLDEIVKELAVEFTTKRHQIMNIIFSSVKKIKPFSNAFILKNPNPADGDDNE